MLKLELRHIGTSHAGRVHANHRWANFAIGGNRSIHPSSDHVVVLRRINAHAAGQLRPDIAGSDLPLIQIMLGAIVDFTREVEGETWRRMLALVIDGLRAREPHTELRAPALGPDEVDRAMRGWKPAPC